MEEVERLRIENAAYKAATLPEGNKYLHIGEYQFEIDDGFSDDGEELNRRVEVPWSVVKDIMRNIRDQALRRINAAQER